MARNNRRLLIWSAVLAGALLMVAAGGLLLARKHSVDLMLRNIFDQVRTTNTEAISAALAEKVEQITQGAETDQERCLRVARWIAGNIANTQQGNSALTAFANRAGLCTERSLLMVRMLKYLSIEARVFAIYHYGRVGGGHSCVQAYYDGGWHFFDPTYAGVFMRDGAVLSWEQIKAYPAAAVSGMVIFQKTLDRHGNIGDDIAKRTRVDNNVRMRRVYTAEKIVGAKVFGFVKRLPFKVLEPVVDCAALDKPMVVGWDSAGQVRGNGVRLGLAENLDSSLMTHNDYFRIRWRFVNCIPGRRIIVRYQFAPLRAEPLTYWAKAEGAKLGGEPRLLPGWFDKWFDTVWEIELDPTKEECSLTLGYDVAEGVDTLALTAGRHVTGIEISLKE